jgi:two-component system, cell cycle sensor histidine kinase and response regulator CckA
MEPDVDRDSSLLSAILNSAGAMIVVLDSEGRIVRFSRACEEATGYSFAEVRGKFVWDSLLVPDEVDTAKQALRSLQTDQTGNQFKSHCLAKNGQKRLFAWSGVRLPEDPSVLWVIGIGIDSTGRRKAEVALRQGQAQLANIIDSATDAIITIDRDQNIVLFNAAAEKMFQCSAESAVGEPIERFIPERFRTAHRNHVEKFDRTNVTKRSMGELGFIWGIRQDGEEFPIEASISQTEVDGQKFYTVIIRDITARKRAEEQLLEQAALLDRASDAIIVRDFEDRILYWNRGAERIYGWTAAEAAGKNIRELYYTEIAPDFEEARQVLLEQGEWAGHAQHLTKAGRQIDVETRWTLVRDDDGNPKSVLVINMDITERKTLEAQFLRAQRMESIGTLAGGIAHDINNILSPILLAVRMLQLKFEDEDSQRLLSVLHKSAERGGVMVKQVLEFARGVEGERIVLQLKHLIKEITKTVSETLPKSIEVECFVPGDVWPVTGDPTQIHQVLMNLIVNARDAMPRGGILSVKAENVSIDESYSRMILDARPGQFVLITVTDTGTGIPAEIIGRVFEPFFTTKEHGKGTGLGLSTVLGIVKSHGGFVNVYSQISRGTQFRAYFPAAESPHITRAREERADVPLGHGELVLVVDDEAAIREITRSTLETFGYNAITAGDGTEAVAIFAQNKDAIEVVLTDMMMPYLDGTGTIRALQKMDPNVKIIASSGLADDGKAAEAGAAGVKIFLSKPYTAEELLIAIAETLAAK